MSSITPTKTNNAELLKGLHNEAEFLFFLNWCAVPKPFREPKTQKELAITLKVDEATISDWKKRTGFWDEVREISKEWAKERTPNVLAAMYKSALSPEGVWDRKLWLQYIENFAEKNQLETKNVHFIITRGDATPSEDRPLPGTTAPVASGNPEPVGQLPV